MFEIAGGIVLAIILIALLPLIIRALLALAAIAAMAIGAGLLIWTIFGLSLPGMNYVVSNWQAVSQDPLFWIIAAGSLAVWVWLVAIAKPDWLQSEERGQN